MNAKLVREESEFKPEWSWINELNQVDEIEISLSLLKDSSTVEPFGSCGKKVIIANFLPDGKLEVTVAAKRTPWTDAPIELASNSKENIEKSNKGSKIKTELTR